MPFSIFIGKYALVVYLKDKKGIAIVNAFQNVILYNTMKLHSMRKPNKIWVNKGSKFYNSSFEKLLKDNDIQLHSTHSAGKSVVAGRFIRTLKKKIYKHMTVYVSTNVYISKLNDLVNKYNNK